MSTRPRQEPIAIVGAGCRFPGGVDSLDAYWRLLHDGIDAVGELPPGRWDNEALFDADRRKPGTTYVRRGAFLREIDGFDPEFFGISPREAASLDPQQRLLLETSWEALENAGIAAASLRGSATGVFVGIGQAQYAPEELYAQPARIGPYSGSGALLSFASGRLSHFLGLNGPSLSVDTACSSSLVAIHLACTSLANRECDTALAAGVHLHLTPHVTLFLSRVGVLAPDGRSKAFDADADGFGRGEGCGVLVLRRLSDALADGAPIVAIVRGSAVNHDGASSGLTVPNPAAQERVIRAALTSGGVAAEAVGYVETHGTGTRLGDPIEVEALATVFAGTSRPTLGLGAVKSSIGHLEAAAGVAGVLKAALVLRHQVLPPQLAFTTPNPDIPWQTLPFTVPTQAVAAPQPLRFAGVSSFGMSGTNAHVVIEQAPAPAPRAAVSSRPAILAMSAHGEAALDELVRRTATSADALAPERFADLCASAVRDRGPMRHRIAFAANGLDETRSILAALARDRAHPDAVRGEAAPGSRGPIAFLFTGQGAQRVGMARRLHAAEPAFRAEIERCADIVDPLLDVPLRRLLLEEVDPELLRRTSLAQPALFALEWALAALWRSWGVEPDMVLGHSLGEYAAACVAGCFSLEEGLMLVAERARLMQSVTRRGAMAAVRLESAKLAPMVARFGGAVEIAGYNSPRSTVVSGDAEAIDDFLARLARDGLMAQRLDVSHAFHCHHLDPVLTDLRRALTKVRFQTPTIELVSNLTGDVVDAATLADPDYWCRHTRSAVRFSDGMACLARNDVAALIELGPQPVLTALGRQSLPGHKALWLPSMVSNADDALQMRRSLAALWASGFEVDLAASAPAGAGRVALPNYPFQNRPIRLPAVPATSAAAEDTMPGRRLALPMGGEVRFELAVSGRDRLLDEHRLFDEVIVPAAWHVVFVCTAMQTLRPASAGVALEDVTFVRAARLPESGLVMQLVLESQHDDRARFRLISRAGDADAFDENSWQTHVTGTAVMAAPAPPVVGPLPRLEARPDPGFYDAIETAGFALGPSFRWMAGIGGDERTVVAALAPSDGARETPGAAIPVGLLDTCFQLMSRFWPDDLSSSAFVPFRIERFSLFANLRDAAGLSALATRDGRGAEGGNSASASVMLLSPDRRVLAAAEGFVFRRVGRDALARVAPATLQVPVWQPVSDTAGAGSPSCLIVAAGPDLPNAAVRLPTLDAADACIGLLQAVKSALDAATPVHVVLVTQGAQAAGPTHRIALVPAALWGFARTLQQEHPSLPFTLVDLDPARPPSEQLDDLRLAIANGEPQLALRGCQHLKPGLEATAPRASEPQVDGEGLFLITGGLGALGLETAAWLAEQGARHLLLVGRSAPSTAASERLGVLRGTGVQIALCRADVADAGAENQLEAAIAATGRPLRGIVHAAGTLDDGIALNQTRARVATVLAPKVSGTLMLDRLATRHEVGTFILYSSVAALQGARGQSSYAAANAFLDALAQDRQARGLPALSVNWGPWADAGMAANHPQAAAALGFTPMAPATALQALGRALASGAPQVEIARRAGARKIARPAAGTIPIAPGSKRQQIEGLVRSRLAEALGLSDGSAIEARARLFDLGLDSLSALEVRDALAAALDKPLHATLLFDHPTVEALVHHLSHDDSADAPPIARDEVAGTIAELSEDEAERALLRALERLDR